MSHHKSKHQENRTSASNDSLGDEDGHQSQTHKAKKRFWLDWEPTEKFTFVIAVFTVIYSVVTIGQYRIAQNTLVVSQRAFVYAKQADILGTQVSGGISRPPNAPILITVTFRNSGQTVARNAITSINSFLNKDGIPYGFAYPVGSQSRPAPIAPQSETKISKPISGNDLSDAESGKTLLFIYGEVSYDDVFGVRHKSEYCFQYFGYSTTPSGELNEFIFFTVPLHNCNDQDCRDK